MSLCYLLSAGQGTRLRPYTTHYAKPVLPLLNLPLAYYGVYLASQGGFKNFLLNKHHLPNQIESLKDQLKPFCEHVETIDETQKLLGSAGAIWNARDILKNHQHFLIANGDEVLIPKNDQVIKELVAHFKKTNSLCTLLTCDHPELLKSLNAVWVDSNNEVQGFGKKAPSPELHPVHYTGYKVFSNKILDWIPEGESNIFYEILVSAIAKGEKVTNLHITNGIWFETGNPNSFFEASRELTTAHWDEVQKRRRFFNLPDLHIAKNDDSILVAERLEDLKLIDQCRGHVVLGEESTIEPDLKIENTIVFSHCQWTASEDPKTGIKKSGE